MHPAQGKVGKRRIWRPRRKTFSYRVPSNLEILIFVTLLFLKPFFVFGGMGVGGISDGVQRVKTPEELLTFCSPDDFSSFSLICVHTHTNNARLCTLLAAS